MPNSKIKQIQLHGDVYDLQVDSVANQNNASGALAEKFDWIGTQAEYIAQDIATNHPNWFCFITDDISTDSGQLNLDDYVKKTGEEEISGVKNFTAGERTRNWEALYRTDFTKGSTPAQQLWWSIVANDSNYSTSSSWEHTRIGTLEWSIDTNNIVCGYFNAIKNTTDSNTSAGVGVYYDTNNNFAFATAPTVGTSYNDDKIATTKHVKDVLKGMLGDIYPPGSIYIGTQSTCPMATLITGSVWDKIEGRYLLASGKLVGGGDAETYSATNTVEAGLPDHNHTVSHFGHWGGGTYSVFYQEEGDQTVTLTTSNASANNNIYSKSNTVRPSAYVVNVWRRRS